MGTRALTVFIDERGEEIAVLYRQFDGYPDGHGHELTSLLKGRSLVNGYTAEDEKSGNFNGMNDLAAGVIAHFKSKSPIGGFYLYPAGTRDIGEEYIYSVRASDHWDTTEFRAKGRIVVTLHTHDKSYLKPNRGIGPFWKPKVLLGWDSQRYDDTPKEALNSRHGK